MQVLLLFLLLLVLFTLLLKEESKWIRLPFEFREITACLTKLNISFDSATSALHGPIEIRLNLRLLLCHHFAWLDFVW